MFCRRDKQLLSLTKGSDEAVWVVDLGQFAAITSLRWCEHRSELILTGTPVDGRSPSVRGNDRGDVRLFRCDPAAGSWVQIYRGYAHDPVCFPEGGYAVHRGAGLTFLDDSGAVVRELKVGRFSWGPPSLSVNPCGDMVAWTRWSGDRQILCVEQVQPGVSERFRVSVYEYRWLDDRTLLYYLGAGLRTLDVNTGRTARYGPGLTAQILRGTAEPPAELDALLKLRDEQFDSVGIARVDRESVWLRVNLASQNRATSFDGLFKADRSGAQLQLAPAPAEFEAMAEFIKAGWLPVPDSSEPEFGFQLPD